MLRSCNFGISGAIDSSGKILIAEEGTNKTAAMEASLSLYRYSTLYSTVGDLPLLLFCGLLFCIYAVRKVLYG
jgi:apolipoprotein N-acyltransferase